ncbi:hypothetical protein ZWY2020_001938 [Hordeum vulgare]|nr:hypothetical protein ZWY2020_001938 [Hordeum vulgare]
MARPLTIFFFLLVAPVVSVRELALVSVSFRRCRLAGGTSSAARTGGVPPQENKDMYVKWAHHPVFHRRPAEFMYKNDSVGKVNKHAYYHCNWTALASTPPAKDGSSSSSSTPLVSPLPAPTSSIAKGQRLMINVKARPEPTPSTDISSPPSPAPPAAAPGPAVPGELVMDSGAGALASSYSRALVLMCFATTLALMGMIQT